GWSCGSGGILSACFLFSSKRRHTRFSRDWSSDVCSSDLHSANSRKVSLLRSFRLPPLDCRRLTLRLLALWRGTLALRSLRLPPQIGRASCRLRVWTSAGVAGRAAAKPDAGTRLAETRSTP